jgi:hypothetical protein
MPMDIIVIMVMAMALSAYLLMVAEVLAHVELPTILVKGKMHVEERDLCI